MTDEQRRALAIAELERIGNEVQRFQSLVFRVKTDSPYRKKIFEESRQLANSLELYRWELTRNGAPLHDVTQEVK